ncbi:MAG: hypothetical protein PUD65_06080 [Spirochaetales bacterium]|nr:hypothetical protein [Spirochaetales bacterium]
MNKKVILSLTISGFLIGCFSALFSFLFFKNVSLEAFVLPFILLLEGLSLSLLKDNRNNLSLILYISSLVIYLVERSIISIQGHKATLGDSILYIVIGIIPFLLFIPFFFDYKRKRSLFVLGSIVISIVMIKLVWNYSVRYVYLYEWVSDWNAYKLATMIGAISLLLALVSKLAVESKRNYLTYLLIIVSGVSYGVGNAIKLGSYPDFLGVIKGCFASVLFWGMLFSLIIFVTMETNKEKEYERRNIIFKDIVYQELKPIKKRKRIITFEVPPNVPKFKYDLTHKKESEIINNKQSDR